METDLFEIEIQYLQIAAFDHPGDSVHVKTPPSTPAKADIKLFGEEIFEDSIEDMKEEGDENYAALYSTIGPSLFEETLVSLIV